MRAWQVLFVAMGLGSPAIAAFCDWSVSQLNFRCRIVTTRMHEILLLQPDPNAQPNLQPVHFDAPVLVRSHTILPSCAGFLVIRCYFLQNRTVPNGKVTQDSR